MISCIKETVRVNSSTHLFLEVTEAFWMVSEEVEITTAMVLSVDVAYC